MRARRARGGGVYRQRPQHAVSGGAGSSFASCCACRWEVAGMAQAEIGKHTSELQSQSNLVCRLLLEKKKNINNSISTALTIHRRIRHAAQLAYSRVSQRASARVS